MSRRVIFKKVDLSLTKSEFEVVERNMLRSKANLTKYVRAKVLCSDIDEEQVNKKEIIKSAIAIQDGLNDFRLLVELRKDSQMSLVSKAYAQAARILRLINKTEES